MLILIPTKNRLKELITTLNYLALNSFFFKKVVIVDSSTLEVKNVIKKKIKNYNFNIEIVNSKPSTCIQRNVGFNFLENNEFIMFLDDDNIFYADAFYQMQEFLINNEDFVGVAFNQIYNYKNNIFEKLKGNTILNNFEIYNFNKGEFSKSGWQSKFINFDKDTIVQWLPTRAVIYKSNAVKNIRFDENFGVYGYLEDLDFSLEIKKIGKLMVCSKAKYTHDQTIKRPGFEFGKKEIRNRYYIVKKHNLSKGLFFITSFLRAIITLKDFIFGDLNSAKRLFGNLVGIISLNKLDKKK
jgi:hypothetical protein